MPLSHAHRIWNRRAYCVGRNVRTDAHRPRGPFARLYLRASGSCVAPMVERTIRQCDGFLATFGGRKFSAYRGPTYFIVLVVAIHSRAKGGRHQRVHLSWRIAPATLHLKPPHPVAVRTTYQSRREIPLLIGGEVVIPPLPFRRERREHLQVWPRCRAAIRRR